MAELHEALTALSPIDWDDVPQDNLEPFIRHIFEAGELICNSVPPPPGGSEFANAKATQVQPDIAKSSKDIVASEARPQPPHAEHVDLQKSWGKPVKLSPKDNPLGISVYKMAGKDRHGAWFARRGVHEGISLTRIRKAMQREFAESLAVQGGPGEGSIRGIGGDRKLDKKEIQGLGQVEAYQLSAQFPGPTAPREFITLLLTSENALSEKTSHDKDKIPRHYMVVSKPLVHPDAPDREGFVKGHYESVELIREIPLHPHSADGDKHELNPVEWIMITRSDPGGGIPRFMVDRGTPSAICADVVKFLDWACGKSTDDIPDPDADEAQQQQAAVESVNRAPPTQQNPSQAPQQQQQQGGYMSSLTSAFEAGLEAYAPASVANYAQGYLHQDSTTSLHDDTSSTSSSDSDDSFASAKDYKSVNNVPAASTDTLGSASIHSSPEARGDSHHDKELRKLEHNKEKLLAKIAKKRESQDDKLRAQTEKEPSEVAKAQEKHDKEMKKLQERQQKELQKLESKREKEIRKAQQKRQKNLDKDTMSRVSRERDDFKTQLDMLKRENGLISDQMADLQRENAILVDKVNRLGGEEALKSIKIDVEHGSTKS